MNNYVLGVWEALNYSIHCLKNKKEPPNFIEQTSINLPRVLILTSLSPISGWEPPSNPAYYKPVKQESNKRWTIF